MIGFVTPFVSDTDPDCLAILRDTMSPLCSASCEFLCGIVGGLVAAVVLYPLEALEAHLHLDDRLAGKSAWQAAGAVYRTRGVSGFTIGMPVSVIGQVCGV